MSDAAVNAYDATEIASAVESVADSTASTALSTANSAQAAVSNAGLAGRNYALLTSTPITRTATTLHPVDSSGNYILDSNGDPIAWTLYFYQALTGNAACEKGTKITVSFDYDIKITEGSFKLIVQRIWNLLFQPTEDMSGHFPKTITLGSTITDCEKYGLVYLQGSFIGSCTISNFKWEIGSSETAWQPAPEDSQMLLQSLTDASKDKTTIYGGLVLSRYLGVKNSSGTIVAGLSGADGAVQNLTPMIWAGATSNTDDGLSAASFRVYNSGKTMMKNAKIVGTDGSKGMTIEGGVIRLGTVSNEEISDSACNMKITPNKDYTTVGNQISALGVISERLWASTTTSTAKSFSPSISYSLSTSGAISQTATTYISISSFTIASTAASGTLTFTNESIAGSSYYGPMQLVSCSNVMATLNSSLSAFSLSVDMSITFRCVVYKNGAETLELFSVKKSASGDAGVDTDGVKVTSCSKLLSLSDMQSVLRWQGTKTMPFAASDVIEIGLYCTIWMQGSGTYTFKPTGETKPTLTISFKPTLGFRMVGVCTPQQPIYSNNYCGNGYTLSSTASKYMAVNSTASDGEIMRLRSSSALVKFNTSGLLQSMNGGSSWFPLNPLAMVLYCYNGANSKPSYTVKYKPRTLAEPSLARTATGTYTLTHSFGANHALLASGAASSTGSTLYMSVYSVASGTDKFVTSDDDTKNDFYCLWLFVFKFD